MKLVPAAAIRYAPSMPSIDQDNLRAAGFMTLSTVFFVINDATMKLASEGLPMLQAMAIRGVMVTAGLAVAAGATGAFARWTSLMDPRVMLRAGSETIGSM